MTELPKTGGQGPAIGGPKSLGELTLPKTGGEGATIGGVSAASARKFFVALLILIIFVVVATEIAGISPAVGKGMLTFFLTLLLLRSITHVNPFLGWIEKVQLTP